MNLNKINLDRVKGILIDLDDTVYNYQKCHDFALDKTYKIACSLIKKEITEIHFKRLYRNCRNIVTEKLKGTGSSRSRLLAFQMLLEKVKHNNVIEHSLILEKNYWDNFINKMKIDKEMYSFLEKINNLSIPVCVVTDMMLEVQIKKIQKLKIINFVNCIVTSEETGKEKPASENFELALRKLGLKPSEAIMIGDSKSKDINGATKIGIKAYLFQASK
jgi:HAD superfamily hydrolase (TIGR01549 family)